jgi:site-specific recombinase XerD
MNISVYTTGFIEDESKVCSARSSTVANWVKETMKNAGVDTKLYGPHSIRSASSTKAVERGYTIEEVKEHANWSRNTQTFCCIPPTILHRHCGEIHIYHSTLY